MTLRLHRPLAVLIGATAAGAASSCSTSWVSAGGSSPAGQVTAPRPAAADRAVAVRTIAQLGHGRQAHFATCTPPACPDVTPKTLAVDPPAAAADAPRVDAGSATDAAPGTSTSPSETFVATAAQAPAALAEPLVTEVIVTFPFGSAVLTAAARAAIDVAAAEDGIRRIDIRGRTDNVGPAPANDVLARQRAKAVAQYLRARHPHQAGAEVSVDARGGCCYATANDTPEGRARNRRVELTFGRDPTDL